MLSDGHILVVDDQRDNVNIIEHLLARSGVTHRIEKAYDGEQAIARLSRYLAVSPDDPPALVLLDLNMPKANGFEVLAWIRRQKLFQQMPVIILSSSGLPCDVERAYDLGANGYLIKFPKPPVIEALFSALATGSRDFSKVPEMVRLEEP